VSQHPSVRGTERDTSGRAVSGEQTVEGVASPIEAQRMTNQGHQRRVVDGESRVVHQFVHELGIVDGQPPDLSKELDLEQGDRGDAPGAVTLDPRECGEPLRTEDDPDEEVGVEEQGHRGVARRGIR